MSRIISLVIQLYFFLFIAQHDVIKILFSPTASHNIFRIR